MLTDDITTYLAERGATDWAARTVVAQRYSFRRLVRWLRVQGIRRWPEVTPDTLDAFLRDLADQGISRKTVDGYSWAIRGFADWLTRRGKVLTNPARDLTTTADGEEPLPPAPLSQAQVARMFDLLPRRHAADLRDRLQVELCYSCGLRRSECIMLDVGDLDMNGRALLVRDGKGGKDRMLPLMHGSLVAARDYLAVRRDLLRGPDGGALFLDRRGRRVDLQVLGRLMRRVSRALGTRVYPHLLRHSIAVHLLQGGADIRYIQEFLGHADLDTTKIYLRLVPGQLRRDYDRAMPDIVVP